MLNINIDYVNFCQITYYGVKTRIALVSQTNQRSFMKTSVI